MSPDAGEAAARAPRVTVAFLLYNAKADVDALLQGLVRQSAPRRTRGRPTGSAAVFVDDASGDGTAEAVARALAGIGSPSHYRLEAHPRNLGLAETLNETFRQAQTPFVLTCHLDCRFGSDRYVASLLDLIEAHPRAAADHRSALARPRRAPAVRREAQRRREPDGHLPGGRREELVPVGFAEGRCDVFRVEALREVGLYDTQLRVSGEDQVLAAKLRDAGYEVYQAPRLAYHLSVSAEQDSVSKILRHQHLFGRTTPYIVLAVPGSLDGLVGRSAGANRKRRALLRATQLAASAALALVPLSLVAGWPAWGWGSALVLVAASRVALLARHARAVRFTAGELLAFALLQPALDLAYTAGILEGLLRFSRGGGAVPID